MTRLPAFFISHGGGPWAWMGGDYGHAFDSLRASLEAIPGQLPAKPKAVLMITAHWEAPEVTLSVGEQPGMLYDYYGFPPETYSIKYPAPGAPELAREVGALLKSSDIAVQFDDQRGYDHGTFVPMAVIYPQADIPLIQMSLNSNLDPATHVAIGKALAPLRDQGVLIIGSGMSFHNLRLMNAAGSAASKQFDDWLQAAVIDKTGAEREALLNAWTQAPAARINHPREEHLLPLMVAAGAGYDDKATSIYHDEAIFGAITSSSFRFG